MNCEEVRQWCDAYRDSELDTRMSQEITSHLQSCAACAKHFQAEADWEGILFGQLREGEASKAFWQAQEECILAQFARREPFCVARSSPPPDALPGVSRSTRQRVFSDDRWAAAKAWLRSALWPHPAFYGGMAVLWMGAAMLHDHYQVHPPSTALESSARLSLETKLALAEQRRQLQLLLAIVDAEAEPVVPAAPKPRSQRRSTHHAG
jgi:anti-sigma factor RsiW